MCYPCMKEEHTQYMLELDNVYISRRIVVLYHEGFTAAQISEITGHPLASVERRIEWYA